MRDEPQALVLVEDEPDLDIAMPQVFSQPPLTTLQRSKLPHVELLVARLQRLGAEAPGPKALGPDYQALVGEFQPLFAWAMASWDFLLTTEGCRFLLRNGDEKLYHRGNYRVFTDRDFSRLVHRIFRSCVFAFAQQAEAPSLGRYLRAHFWDIVVDAYRTLQEPPDPRQRPLTPYSYLRCIPYEFLNAFHRDLAARTLQTLPAQAQQAVQHYFLEFFTREATATHMGLPLDAVDATLHRGLVVLLVHERLVYCLLRQIERY